MADRETPRGLEGPSPIRLTTGELATLLESAEVVHTESTSVAGEVRVLDVDGALFVQERTPDGQVLLRPRPGIEEAMAFVERRRSAYGRMWDG